MLPSGVAVGADAVALPDAPPDALVLPATVPVAPPVALERAAADGGGDAVSEASGDTDADAAALALALALPKGSVADGAAVALASDCVVVAVADAVGELVVLGVALSGAAGAADALPPQRKKAVSTTPPAGAGASAPLTTSRKSGAPAQPAVPAMGVTFTDPPGNAASPESNWRGTPTPVEQAAVDTRAPRGAVQLSEATRARAKNAQSKSARMLEIKETQGRA